MTAASQTSSAAVISPRNLLLMAGGGIVGAGVGFGVVRLMRLAGVRGTDVGWTDMMALWLGLVFIGLSIVVASVASNRRLLARSIEGDNAELPATNEEVSLFRKQAGVLALAGILLLAPLAANGAMRVHPESATGIAIGVYAGMLLLFALQTVMNVQTWRRSDEYARRSMLITAAGTFAIGQGLLFLWAAAERLRLAPAVSSWTVVMALMTIYLAVSGYVALKQRCQGL